MAISYVGGVVAGRVGIASTVSVALNSGLTGGSNPGVSAGDLVVVTVCTGTAARQPDVSISGYTALTVQRTTATSFDTNVQTCYKFMGGTPDTSVIIPSTVSVADGQAYAVQVFRGVDSTTPLDVTSTYATGSGTNNNPNPAAITPTTAGTWILACGGGASNGGNLVFTTATLTNFLSAVGNDNNDGTVGVGYYTAWSSGAYDPAEFGGGVTNANNSWGATTIALRPAAEVLTLTPSLYSNGQTFYTPTITVGTVSLTPSLYENANTFYTHVVTQPVASQDLTPALYENGNTFYSAALSLNLNATRYDDSNTFYDATVTTGAVTLTAALFTNDNTFYATSVTTGAVNVSAGLFTNANEFYATSISVGSVTLTLDIFVNSNTFYSPAVTTGAVTLSASLYSNTNTYYEHSIFDSIADIPASSFIVQARRRFTR